MIRELLTVATDRIYAMPVLVLMPHSSCNCRCVMCDIWKANANKKEISVAELDKHLKVFQQLGVKHVALSGGEALLHSNLWLFCERLKSIGVKISLLTTGVALSRNAEKCAQVFDDIIVSLDGTRDTHNRIRNIPLAFEKLEEGVQAIREIALRFPIKARCVLQKQNFREVTEIVLQAKRTGFSQISFLAADVSTEAFNRPELWSNSKVDQVALSKSEIDEFVSILESGFRELRQDYDEKFIFESPTKMLAIAQYYKGLLGLTEFPKTKCNAPWVSAVIETDGNVLPCFFHKPYGNISNGGFRQIINSPKAITFRKKLNVNKDPICKKCVCSLNVSIFKSDF